MLPPLDTIQNIKNLTLNVKDPLAKKNQKITKLLINHIPWRCGSIVAHFDVLEIARPSAIELTMSRVSNGSFNIKIYLKYTHSDLTGDHYVFDRSEGEGDWKFYYSELTARIYSDLSTYRYGGHKRYFFLNMNGDFERYDMSNISITVEMKYNDLPSSFLFTETYINSCELPPTELPAPLYIEDIVKNGEFCEPPRKKLENAILEYLRAR